MSLALKVSNTAIRHWDTLDWQRHDLAGERRPADERVQEARIWIDKGQERR